MNRENQTLELIHEYQSGQADTRNEIIKLNMPLIHFCVNKFKPKKLEYEDAVSVAMWAFSQAINDFDEDKGVKFSTFSATIIRFRLWNQYRSIKKHQLEVSCEAPIYQGKEGNTISLIDTLQAPEKEHIFWDEVNELTASVIRTFPEDQRTILIDFLKNSHTQYELAKKYSVSQAQISRITIKFFKALKLEAERQGFREKEGQTMAKPTMTVDQYKTLINKGLSIPEMATELGIQTKSIYNWRTRHKDKIKNLPDPKPSSSEKQKNVTKNVKNVQKLNENAPKRAEIENLKRIIDQQTKELNSLHSEKDEAKDSETAIKEKLLKAESELTDVNHQLAYTAQERDKYQIENKRIKSQLHALEQYVFTLLRPDESA